MLDFFQKLVDVGDFPPRWYCGLWTSFHGWLHVGSDLAIFGAYMAIPIFLAYTLLRRGGDVPHPFPKILILFIAFIVACGITHLNEAIIFWHPIYRIQGLTKLATAAVSWATVLALMPALPVFLGMKTPEFLRREVAEKTAELRQERDAAAALAAIVEASDDAIFSQDFEGVVLSWNPAAERLYGYSAADMIGQPVARLVPETHLEELGTLLARIEAGERIQQMETVHQDQGERRLDVALTISPVRDHRGEITSAAVIARDISAQKHAAEQLQQQAEELQRSNKELEQFAYVASHDLQEPLRMVASYSKLLQRKYQGKLDEQADEYILFLSDGAKRMQQLIKDLLEFSRVSRRDKPFVDTSVQTLMERVVHGLRARIDETGATIRFSELPTVPADTALLGQVFHNLLSNALKFRGQAPPDIEVSAYKERGHWRFSVRDNGIGMDPEYQDRIFEMFQRLHTRKEYQGSGIGLALTKKIVERHGGRIWVEATGKNGTTFAFTLHELANRGTLGR